MAKGLENYDFLVCEDGIYFGRALKNGNVSADARKIEREEIINLFSAVCEDFCLRYQQPLVIERNGKPFIQAALVIDGITCGNASETEK